MAEARAANRLARGVSAIMPASDLVNLSGLMDDAKCFALVRQHRWPEGVCCPGWGRMRIRVGAEGPSLRKRTVAVLHAMLWVGLATAGRSGLKEGLQAEFDVAHAYHTFDGAFAQSRGQREDIGAAGIARKVIPRVRPPVCCVQWITFFTPSLAQRLPCEAQALLGWRKEAR